MTSLDLSGNDLTSLTLPEGLKSLTTLNLSENALTDYSFLEGLSNLTTLDASHNGLKSLTLPQGLTSLTSLDLRFNPLETLEVPIGFDREDLELIGFVKSNVTFYIPIDVTKVGDNVEVRWTQGVLQSVEMIGGSWTDVPNATSPHVVETAGPQQFFRVMPE